MLMTGKVWSLLLVLGLLVCSALAQSKVGFNQVLSHLGNFQAPNGGFRNTDGLETVDASSSALLLSSLYGLNAKINTVEAAKYLTSLENSDGGYGKATGAPSDVESTRHALAGLSRLSTKATNTDKTVTYLKSQLKDTGLIGGSVRSTALALQAFELLGQKIPQDIATAVKAALKKDTFGESAVEIFYGVLAARLVGLDVAADKLAQSLVNLQSPQGLFYTDASKRSTSLQATADALLALHTLGSKYVDSVNTATLRSAVRYIPADVEAAADAHVALAVTKAFRDNFVVVTGSGSGAARDVIVEGSSVRPVVSVSAKETGGVSHSGFDVSSTHTFSGKPATKGKLSWNQESQSYTGESLASAGNFGPFNSVYTLSTIIPGVGPISFDVNDTKNVGYGIVIDSKATIELSGRDVKENEQVTVGTDFTFGVSLSSQSKAKLLSGDFAASFTVLDSSDVIIHQSSIDGSANSAPIAFVYKLSAADLPAGRLSFRFDISSKSGAVHTTRTVFYYLNVAMVASNIAFDQKVASYKIGDTVKLSIEPATFPDLRTPHTLSTKNAKNGDATASRHFFLDVKTPQGSLVRTVEGQSTKTSRYTFTIPVEATFASLGVNTLSFRYKPASGEEIPLQNFDSLTSELYEDVNVLNYTIKADLALVDVVEKPKSTNLFYGDTVVFKFRVKDAASGKYLVPSAESAANVFLALQTEQEKGARAVSSVNVPAFAVKDHLVANWTINANAHKGNGVLTLVVKDADGKVVALKDVTDTKVTIGGDLEFSHQTLSTSPLDTTLTAFIVELDIKCKGRALKDAQLLANVVYSEGSSDVVVATLPVARNDNQYSVSWSAPHREAKSGTYKINFFREADRLLAVAKRDQKEKEARKAKQMKGEEEHTTTFGGEVLVDPIYSVSLVHSAPRFTRLPVKAEFLALMIFGGIVFWLINKRSNLK